MKTQVEARREFAILYEEVKLDAARDGGHVTKSVLWETFIEHGIDDERFPANAVKWKMPRTTK
jgi:hypothetical protein